MSTCIYIYIFLFMIHTVYCNIIEIYFWIYGYQIKMVSLLIKTSFCPWYVIGAPLSLCAFQTKSARVSWRLHAIKQLQQSGQHNQWLLSSSHPFSIELLGLYQGNGHLTTVIKILGQLLYLNWGQPSGNSHTKPPCGVTNCHLGRHNLYLERMVLAPKPPHKVFGNLG